MEAGGWDGPFVWDHIASELPPGRSHPTAADPTAYAAVGATWWQHTVFGYEDARAAAKAGPRLIVADRR